MEQKESLVEFTQKWLEEYGKIVSAYSHASVGAILSATVKIPTAIDLLSALQEREVRVLAEDQELPRISPHNSEAFRAGGRYMSGRMQREGFARVEKVLTEAKKHGD